MRFFPFVIVLLPFAIALYSLVLEAFYPFDSFPIAISDNVKQSLKLQAVTISFCYSAFSISFLFIILYLFTFFFILTATIYLVMRFRPAFREKVAKRMAENTEKQKDRRKHSKSRFAFTLFFILLFNLGMIANDAIFNRPRDVASFKDAVIMRLQSKSDYARGVAYFQFLFVSAWIVFGTLSSISQARAARRANEESRLGSHETAEVQVTVTQEVSVLEEKLIDFSDGVDGLYEKMATSAPAHEDTNEEEEPLIRL